VQQIRSTMDLFPISRSARQLIDLHASDQCIRGQQ